MRKFIVTLLLLLTSMGETRLFHPRNKHPKPIQSRSQEDQAGPSRRRLPGIPLRSEPSNSNSFDVQIILPQDRCKPGKFKWAGGSCDVLGRGTSVLFERSEKGTKNYNRYANNPLYEQGEVGGKVCFYLREDQTRGATPIPSNQQVILKYRSHDIGPPGKNHWAIHDIDPKTGRPRITATPTFFIRNNGGRSSRIGNGSVIMHTHGKYDHLPLWQLPTWGCLKLPVDCMQKFYEHSKKLNHPEFRAAIWEKT